MTPARRESKATPFDLLAMIIELRRNKHSDKFVFEADTPFKYFDEMVEKYPAVLGCFAPASRAPQAKDHETFKEALAELIEMGLISKEKDSHTYRVHEDLREYIEDLQRDKRFSPRQRKTLSYASREFAKRFGF